MGKLGLGRFSILFVLLLVSITSTDDQISTAPKLPIVELSSTEVHYLNERLQDEEHMGRDDAMNTIIELEHSYTLIKMNDKGTFSPSAMVDKAWHQHILHTQMYNTFSRRHFSIEFLRHVPFWSGNDEEMEQISTSEGDSSAVISYNKLVSVFGLTNINSTVWLLREDESNNSMEKTLRDKASIDF